MTSDLGPQDCTSQALDAIKVHSVSHMYSNCTGTDWACFWLALTKPSRKISLKYVLLKTWSSLSFFIVF